MAEDKVPEYGATDNDVEVGGGDILPTYEETANAAPPPSYDSLYGRIRDARDTTDNHASFLKKVCSILLNTVGFMVLTAVFLAIPVAMIVIGALNLENCTIQKSIPIWLVVSGATCAVQQLGNLYDRAKAKCSGKTQEEIEEETSALWRSFNGCLGCFNFAWFIVGNVWVYGIRGQVTYDDASSSTYCDRVAYEFAFWIITATYIVLATICFCTCCIAVCVSKN